MGVFVIGRSGSDSFPFVPNTLLAPMEGITRFPFRNAIAEIGGIGLLCTEFVRISRAPISEKALQKEVKKTGSIPLSVQVMGNEADKMAEAAGYIEKAGADAVDINVGCPMPRVVRKGVGAALLKNPSILQKLVSQMRAEVRGLLSAKIRAGWDNSDEIVDIALMLQNEGIDFLTVHPRKRVDYYKGTADWRITELLAKELSIPVVGNGDLWFASEAIALERESGVSAIMIGRPALRNPWIFRQIAELRAGIDPALVFEPNANDVWRWIDRLREVHAENSNRVGNLKEHLRYLMKAWVGSDHKILRAKTMPELLAYIEQELQRCKLDLGFQPLPPPHATAQ